MAKNIVIEPSKYLFKAGDPSDGMYIVRSGELEILLEQEGSEISLAKVPPGGIVGDMALFDSKPRSASVRATKPTEVSFISTQEFQKLAQQIPKWFGALMATLSGRLRETNERLQKLEAKGGTNPTSPILRSIRLLSLLDLVIARHGQKAKDDKAWTISSEVLFSIMHLQFGEDQKILRKVLDVLVANGQLEDKNRSITIPYKGALTKITTMMSALAPGLPSNGLPMAGLEILSALVTFSTTTAYESFTASLTELRKIGQNQEAQHLANWEKALKVLEKNSTNDVKVIPLTSDGSPGVRADRKTIKEFLANQKMIGQLCKAFM